MRLHDVPRTSAKAHWSTSEKAHRPNAGMRLIAKPRPQGGYTLIELLVAIAITAIIFVPLMAWASLAIKQMPVTQDGLTRTAQTGLLGSMFPADVTIAGQAWVSGMSQPTDCDGGSAAGGSVKLVMITGGATVKKLVYTVARSSDDPSEWSIWRRSCGVGPTSPVQSEHQLFKNVRANSTVITCRSADCREIALTTTPVSNDQPIVMSATRRVDAGSVPLDVLGDPLPFADITLEYRTAGQSFDAGFSASRSSVAAGRTIASYAWTFDDGVALTLSSVDTDERVSATFPSLPPDLASRGFTVQLTVTDNLGKSNNAILRISSTNLVPVAAITSITPNPVEVGQVVKLSTRPVVGSLGSYDPDGAIVRYDWTLTLPETRPEVMPETVHLSGDEVSYRTPPGSAGNVKVVLAVTDLQLGRSTDSKVFEIVDPSAPPTTIPGPTTTVPGSLAAVFTDAPGASALVRTFDASGSTGVDAGTTFAWSFGDGTSGTGAKVSHTYPNGGVYLVLLTVTTSDSRVVTANRSIELSGGAPAPRNVRHNGTSVLWDPAPGARRYRVDFEFRTARDCFRVIDNQMVGASPAPSKTIPRNPCPRSATGRARVGTDSVGGVNWSSWISIPMINGTAPGPTTTVPPEVVK